MTRVICLVGASGSGKTTIAKELEGRGYNVIHSYTTRPPREKNEWGHIFINNYEAYVDVPVDFDGFFVSEIYDKDRDVSYSRDDMIGYIEMYGEFYFATDEQVVRGKDNIYVVDPEGAKKVHKFYKDTDVKVITIYLQVDEEIRAKRLAKRNKELDRKCFKYKDIPSVWERLKPDRELFSVIECNYTVNANGTLKTTIQRLSKIIGSS